MATTKSTLVLDPWEYAVVLYLDLCPRTELNDLITDGGSKEELDLVLNALGSAPYSVTQAFKAGFTSGEQHNEERQYADR